MKISKKKLLLILIPISLLCVGLVDLLVNKIFSKNDVLLFNMRSIMTFAAVIAVVITIILIIVDAVKSLKKKKNCLSRLLLIMAAVSVILVASNFILIEEDNKYFHAVNVNWQMHLPGNYKEVYYKENTSAVSGDGQVFSIFEYEDQDEINNIVKWTKGSNVKDVETPVVAILDSLHVDFDKYPDFNSDYKYYHQNKDGNSDIYLITNDKSKKVYIVENLN